MFEKLKKNSDFQHVKSQKSVMHSSTLIISYMRSFNADEAKYRVGFVVSRKVGHAVKRNCIKRRLRAITSGYGGPLPDKAMDLVFIARSNAASSCYQTLRRDYIYLMKKLCSLDV